MSDLNLTKLREIAEAATPGPWNLETPRVDAHYIHGFSDEQDVDISVQCDAADATHIAAFDPPTVLALIDEVEWLRDALTSSEYMRDVQRKDRTAQAFEQLRAKNDQLRAVVKQVRELAESYPPTASTRPAGTDAIRIHERYVVARKFRAILDGAGAGES